MLPFREKVALGARFPAIEALSFAVIVPGLDKRYLLSIIVTWLARNDLNPDEPKFNVLPRRRGR